VDPIPLEDTEPPSTRSKPTTSLDILYGTVTASQPVVDYKGNSADMYIYDENFDELDEPYQCASIVTLLESLPPISQMRKYLMKTSITSEGRLQDWNDRISPSALGLLRWVVASNRSYIVYVGGSSQIDKLDSNSQSRSGEKVTNMDGWVQFRLAQGAPDKEQRFHQALLQKSSTRDSSHPTLFAWHGSHLFNWHSIIRSGLDFKEVQNARAFGHGCYHSQDFNTSLGYSGGGVFYSAFLVSI
jgi:ubiquitin-conjugating enzyme E2 Q